ncbi:MAG: histidinol-phosphatase [Deltaproteobacteria bacterium]|nr:histidinol-phosphatase [Deltaproteobacteria bacterium]
MPWFSFHGGHSGAYCRHARATLEQVVERAYAVGYTTFGLSEHAPRFRAEDLFPDESDLIPADLELMFDAYLQRATTLRAEWSDRLELIVGFESEVIPGDTWLSKMQAIRNDPRIEYVVGSVHTVGGVCIDLSAEKTAKVAENLGGTEALHRQYFADVTAMIEALRPDVIGHLDLIRKFDGHAPNFSSESFRLIDRALEATRSVGAALDVNASPARKGVGPVYPMREILERAYRMGVAVTLGDDSHGPDDVGVGLSASVAAIANAGYKTIRFLSRSDGVATWHDAPIEQVAPARRTP